MSNTRLKITEFTNLKKGWCHGEGLPIKREAMLQAEDLFLFFIERGIHRTNAFPCINGGVMVTGYLNNHYIEFTLENDRTVTYYYELDGEWTDYFDYLTLEKAKEYAAKKIAEIKNGSELCQKSLGYSVKNITGMQKKIDSKAQHFKHQTSPYFSVDALVKKVAVYVITLENSTAQYLTRQFIGSSTQNRYLKAAH
jgi:hypothetical protein